MEQNMKSCEATKVQIEEDNHESAKSSIVSQDEIEDKEFEDEVGVILEKLKKLPSTASELKISTIALNGKEVYSKLCKALKVPVNFTFLSNVDSERLDFSYQSLGPTGITPVAKALILCKNMKLVDFKYNRLGSNSLPAITTLLNRNENIVHLNLSGNSIGKGAARLLSELIAHCHSVEFLDLSNNDLGDDELQEIGLASMKVDSVKELNLNTNDFSSARAPAFGSFISKCSALLKLDLSCCHLEEGATNIFSGLKISNLTHLNLSRNGIPNEAMPALASGLRANKSLQELNISCNSISNKGAMSLAPGLKGSTTLEVVNLSHNPIQGSAACTLLNAVGGNLKLLDLSGIKVSLPFFKTLKDYAKAGKEVKVLFGSDIRYDCFPRNFDVPEEGCIDETNVVTFLEKMADDKGVSLRNILKNIHANFIAEHKDGELSDTSKGQKSPEMSTEDLAKGLVTSPISFPKPLALQVAELLGTEGFIDMWDLLRKIRWKPDDLFVKIKAPVKPPTEKPKKKKAGEIFCENEKIMTTCYF